MAEQPALAQLVELLRAEMCARWQRGERVPAEQYLRQHPALQADPAEALKLVYQELLLRERHGEALRPEEYLERFPQFATQLEPRWRCIRRGPHRRLQSRRPDGGDGER